MGAGKNKNHRKKRISKHVLEAQALKKQTETENELLSAAERKGTADGAPSAVTTNATAEQEAATTEKSVPKSKTRDPEVASSYLSLWNYDRTNNTKTWKFNKNTQSWLLRQMYDFDKVSKATFAILVDYLCQGGDGARSRVEEEAKRRARRYKEWEKKAQQEEEEEKGDIDETEEAKEKTESKDKVIQSAEDVVWKDLDDHDKRKEYKRARKVLDALKASSHTK
mmetsp:Transcript_324/g.631  ORF Transcript_324/g.631 Transcript_324/m.631 type:complete len:224 (-) Transcript_324:45-716(-)